jgi:nucleotide-binding universal stress UspA family protein
MNKPDSHVSIVVGIDGSEAAINAALWATDEATSRDMPLRLVYATYVDPATHVAADDYQLGIQYGETALRHASAAVAATGKPVKVETAVLRGRPVPELVAESRDAAMICVGSVGIGVFARMFLGSTAAELAEQAYCPVAIIRTRQNPLRSTVDWLVVVINGSPDNEAVVQLAMEEARLRQAPILGVGVWEEDLGENSYDALDNVVDTWRRRYPDVRVQPVATPGSLGRFLGESDERIQLAVIGSSEAGQVAQIVGPRKHPIFGHAKCSVLVVHP